MNSLNKELQVGQFVVFKKEIMRDEYQSLEWRTAEIITDSFGCQSFTSGTDIFVRFKDGEKARMSGMDIEGLATEERYFIPNGDNHE